MAGEYSIRGVTRDNGNGYSYAVLDASGRRVGGLHGTSESALARAEALQRRSKRKLRSCLTCEAEFLSEGPHNRMCDPCRKAGGRADMTPYSTHDRRR